MAMKSPEGAASSALTGPVAVNQLSNDGLLSIASGDEASFRVPAITRNAEGGKNVPVAYSDGATRQ
jgi:hypothetical protein